MSIAQSQPNPPFFLVCRLCRLVHDEREAMSGWLSKEAFFIGSLVHELEKTFLILVVEQSRWVEPAEIFRDSVIKERKAWFPLLVDVRATTVRCFERF